MKTNNETKLKLIKSQIFGEDFIKSDLNEFFIKKPQFEKKVKKFIDNPKNSLVYLAPKGSGKTYFCSALTEILDEKFGKKWKYFTQNEIFNMVVHHNSYSSQVIDLINDIDLLIIDDFAMPGYYNEELENQIIFEILDRRGANLKPTIYTSTLNKSEIINNYCPRFCSRLFAYYNTILEE